MHGTIRTDAAPAPVGAYPHARRVHLVADLRSGNPAIVGSAREQLLCDIEALAREHDIEIRVNDFDVRQIRHYPESGLEL